MRRLSYDIATRNDAGCWDISLTAVDGFSRDPRLVARSLLEQWINDNLGRLPGGRVLVFAERQVTRPVTATVRVRVYAEDAGGKQRLIAVAYLGELTTERTGGGAWLRRWFTGRRRADDGQPVAGCGALEVTA